MRNPEEGVLGNPTMHPAVPQGRVMFRASYMAIDNRDHTDQALEVVGRELRLIEP